MSSRAKAAKGIARKFIDNVVPGIIKPVHSLWNEVIGFLFLVLGAWRFAPSGKHGAKRTSPSWPCRVFSAW